MFKFLCIFGQGTSFQLKNIMFTFYHICYIPLMEETHLHRIFFQVCFKQLNRCPVSFDLADFKSVDI